MADKQLRTRRVERSKLKDLGDWWQWVGVRKNEKTSHGNTRISLLNGSGCGAAINSSLPPQPCPSNFSSNLSSSVCTLLHISQFLFLICIQVNLRLENLGEHISCLRWSSAANNITSLVLRFVKDQFDDYRESTIGGQQTCFMLL